MLARLLTAFWLIGLLLTSSAAAQHTTQPDAPAKQGGPDLDTLGLPAETEPAYTQEQVNAWRAAMIPHVEAVAGRTFASTPKLHVTDREGLLDIERRDLEWKLKGITTSDVSEVDLDIAMLDRVVEVAFRLGFYSIADQQVYLPAGNVRPIMGLKNIDEAQLENVMKLVVAHELAHVLHGQHVDLEAHYQPTSLDQKRAYQSTLEGFAMLVQQRVAERLSLSALNEQLSSSNADTDETIEAVYSNYKQNYLAGRDFMQHHFDEAGIEHVWSILESPPQTYAQITAPQTYGQPLQRRIVAEKLFEGVGEHFGVTSRPMVLSVDPESASRTFAVLGRSRAEQLQQLFTKAHNCVFRQGSAVRVVSVFEARDPVAAREIITAIDQLADKQFEMFRSLKQQGRIDLSEQRESDPQGNRFTLRATITETDKADAQMKMLIAAQRCGDDVVQIVVTGAELSEESAQAMNALLCERLAGDDIYETIPQVDQTDPLAQALARIPTLLDGDEWETEQRRAEKASIEKLLASHEEALLALEFGYENAHAIQLVRTDLPRNEQPFLIVTLLQCNHIEVAKAIGEGVGEHLDRTLSHLGAMAELGSVTQHTLESGQSLWRVKGDIAVMGESATLSASCMQRGKRVAWWIEMREPLGFDRVPALADLLFDK